MKVKKKVVTLQTVTVKAMVLNENIWILFEFPWNINLLSLINDKGCLYDGTVNSLVQNQIW